MSWLKKQFKKILLTLFGIGIAYAALDTFTPVFGVVVDLNQLKTDFTLSTSLIPKLSQLSSQQFVLAGKYRHIAETDTGLTYKGLPIFIEANEYVKPDKSIGYFIVFRIYNGKTKYVKSIDFGTGGFTSDWEEIKHPL